MNRKKLLAGFLALLTLSVVGCGGSSGSSTPMTQTQAAAAFADVYTAMAEDAGSLQLARSAPTSPIRMESAVPIQKAILNSSRTPVSADSVAPVLRVSPDTTTNLPSYTYDCPSGGTIVVTGSYSETTSGTTTSESANIVETINSCRDSGVTMNGDPNIAFSMAGSDNGTTTSATLTMTGGLTVGSSSCATDLVITVSLNDKTGSGTETYNGSFCGIVLSGSATF